MQSELVICGLDVAMESVCHEFVCSENHVYARPYSVCAVRGARERNRPRLSLVELNSGVCVSVEEVAVYHFEELPQWWCVVSRGVDAIDETAVAFV